MLIKKIIVSVLIIFIPSLLWAVNYTSKDNNTGWWYDSSTWDGSAPSNDDINLGNGTITIDGFVKWETLDPSDSTLTFDGGGGGTLIVEDTLVIFGNLHLGNNYDLTVNGILIVYGDVSSTNKINIASSGFLIIQGDMDFGGAQGGIETGDESNVYIGGDCSGSGDCDATSNDSTDLEDADIDVDDFYDDNDPDGCTEPIITSTTSDTRCGTGTVTLGATASAGTINWYDVATGGTSLATGTTFTTPSISTTTTYWVDATDAGCTTASRTAITATVNPLPTVTLIVDPAFDTICTGNNSRIQINFDLGVGPFDFTVSREDELSIIITDNLSDINTDPYFYEPSPTWEDDGTPETDYFYSITSITDANGCVNNAPQGNVKVTVFKIPETGPQYHISNDWGN